jgi:hypothetical protein
MVEIAFGHTVDTARKDELSEVLDLPPPVGPRMAFQAVEIDNIYIILYYEITIVYICFINVEMA